MPCTVSWKSPPRRRMVAHHHPGVTRQPCAPANLAQPLQPHLPVAIVFKHVLAPFTARHHMINGTRGLVAQWSSHKETLPENGTLLQPSFFGTDLIQKRPYPHRLSPSGGERHQVPRSAADKPCGSAQGRRTKARLITRHSILTPFLRRRSGHSSPSSCAGEISRAPRRWRHRSGKPDAPTAPSVGTA